MRSQPITHNSKLSSRRGFIAISLAVIMLALVLSLISIAALDMTAAAAHLQRAEAQAQAFYAAEAGLDLAASGNREQSGHVGPARFIVSRQQNAVVSLGGVQQPSGAWVLAVVTLTSGTWRQVPPGQYPDLISRIQSGM